MIGGEIEATENDVYQPFGRVMIDDEPDPLRPVEFNACRSEEHTSELQSLMRISYAVFCLKKKKETQINETTRNKKHTHNKTFTHTSIRNNSSRLVFTYHTI